VYRDEAGPVSWQIRAGSSYTLQARLDIGASIRLISSSNGRRVLFEEGPATSSTTISYCGTSRGDTLQVEVTTLGKVRDVLVTSH
jgi:hypothetical protein